MVRAEGVNAHSQPCARGCEGKQGLEPRFPGEVFSASQSRSHALQQSGQNQTVLVAGVRDAPAPCLFRLFPPLGMVSLEQLGSKQIRQGIGQLWQNCDDVGSLYWSSGVRLSLSASDPASC